MMTHTGICLAGWFGFIFSSRLRHHFPVVTWPSAASVLLSYPKRRQYLLFYMVSLSFLTLSPFFKRHSVQAPWAVIKIRSETEIVKSLDPRFFTEGARLSSRLQYGEVAGEFFKEVRCFFLVYPVKLIWRLCRTSMTTHLVRAVQEPKRFYSPPLWCRTTPDDSSESSSFRSSLVCSKLGHPGSYEFDSSREELPTIQASRLSKRPGTRCSFRRLCVIPA